MLMNPRNNFVLQLTGILLAISLLPLLLFVFFSHQTTEEAVLELAARHNMEMLGHQKKYLGLQMTQIEALAANLGQVDEISAALAATNTDRQPNSYDNLATKARLGYLLSNYRNLKGLVSIDVFSLSGVHYHVGDSLTSEGERDGVRDRLLERTLKSGSSVVWHGVEDNVQRHSSSSKVVVATKLLVRPDSSWLRAEPVGMLVVNFSTDHLHEHFSQIDWGQGGYLLVLDDQKRLVFSPDKAQTGAAVPEGFAALLQGESGSFIQPVDGVDMLLSYQQMPDKGWYVASLVPEDTLLSPMTRVRQMGLLLLLAGFVLIVLFVQLLVVRVVKPIGAIADGFKRFQQGRLDPNWRMPRPHSFAQIAELVKWFNAFLDHMAKREEANTRLRIAATAFDSQEGMLVTDADHVILQVNRAFTELTGYSAEDAIGQTPKLLNSGMHDAGFFARMYQELQGSGHWRGEIWNRRKDGTAYPEWLTITAVKDGQDRVTHYVATMLDITQRKAAEEEIRNLAFFDALTQLPNRRLLTDRLTQAIADTARHKRCGALMLLDLDKFKVINDTLGHAAGDQLLQNVAQRLVGCVREADTVARLGGDEFVVLLAGLSPFSGEAASQAQIVGQKMIGALREIHVLDGTPFQSSASFGVTVFSDAACTPDELMKQADIAMYQAKESGRNTLVFFDPFMHQAVVARASLELELKRGLSLAQLALRFQPVFSGHEVRGAEALLRWEHPVRGLVLPGDFIPLAEDTGLIVPLGLWVLKEACQTLVRWSAHPQRAQWVLSVNVSARQFRHPDFLPSVQHILEETGVNPSRLKMEITESLLIHDVDDVVLKMQQLKTRGLSFSLDDFGTGYSSLAYLKRMPLSEIKIDRSFVRDILTDPNDAIMVRTILGLGQSMGLDVVAEGVETGAQRAFLAEHGCLLFQGDLFSAPLTLEGLEVYALSHATCLEAAKPVQVPG